MSLTLTMAQAMWSVLDEIATNKTDHHFLAGVRKKTAELEGVTLPEKVIAVAKTFCAVMGRPARNSMLEADDDRYPVSEYRFPVNWWQLAMARLVYATSGAVDMAEPWFKADSVDGAVLSPRQVDQFFKEFNSEQDDENQIEVGGIPEGYSNAAYLGQFKALVCGDRMAEMNRDSGVIDDVAAQILGIEHPMDGRYLRTWEKYEERSVRKWLMSVK